MSAEHEARPEWIDGDGPDGDVVISTRARLARSLAQFPFPSRASREDLTMVAREVRGACSCLSNRFPDLRAIGVARLTREQKAFLLDAHVASVEHLQGGAGRLVLLEPSSVLSIMINEEDHLRIQALFSGLVPKEAWDLVNWVDDVLCQRLDYGYSTRYGYLTASVSNVGTGLRISMMMHLAGLAMRRQLHGQLRAAYDLGVSIRGMFGEGSRSVGDLYQVSNEVTLGVSETEILEKVRAVAQYLLCEERRARKELLDDERNRLVGDASSSLKTLRHSMAIRSEEAIRLLSPVRLAAALGLVENCSGRVMNEALVGVQVGAGDDGTARIERASFLRNKLANVDIKSS